MNDSSKCPRCGGELPTDFPPGVCPACLLKQGLSPSTVYRSGVGSQPRRGWVAPTPAELAPHFPQLEIAELLGQGGMGAVYKVRQKELDRWAALKVLPDDVAQDPTFAERFQREARALAQLSHQHIVVVYEFGQRDGVYFLLMEYVDGVTLRQAMRAGAISDQQALHVVSQICEALQFAHEEGVVHRDIKPENILIDRRGRVKIADFGLAKLLGRAFDVPTLTGTHQVMGTPVYMAPEQMEGRRGVDHRADIFSLGVVFYELLTGELPLGRFPLPSQKVQLDVRLDDVVLRTLEREPDRRYQRASEVRNDVESIRSTISKPTPAPAKQSRRSFRLWRQRGRPGLEQFSTPGRRRSWRKRLTALALVLMCVSTAIMFNIIREQGRTVQSLIQTSQHLKWDLSQAQHRNQQNQTQQQVRRNQASAPAQSNQNPYVAYAIVQFIDNKARLNPHFSKEKISDEQREIIDRILDQTHKSYVALEEEHSERSVDSNNKQYTVARPVDSAGQLVALENSFWTAIDQELPIEQQRYLRAELPLYALAPPNGNLFFRYQAGPDPQGHLRLDSRNQEPDPLFFPQLLGWSKSWEPVIVEIGRSGKWYTWEIQIGEKSAKDQAPELPPGLRRFWREDAVPDVDAWDRPSLSPYKPSQPEPISADSTEETQPERSQTSDPNASPPPGATLDELLPALAPPMANLDAAAAANYTELTERKLNELLNAFILPENQARIQRRAVELYEADRAVFREQIKEHAREGLNVEQNHIEQIRLYISLGDAELPSRVDAASTFFAAYNKLKNFDLPQQEPTIPEVANLDEAIAKALQIVGGDVDTKTRLAAVKARHAAEMDRRKVAEQTRDLVRIRDVVLDRIRSLWPSQEEQAAENVDPFWETATQTLRPMDRKRVTAPDLR